MVVRDDVTLNQTTTRPNGWSNIRDDHMHQPRDETTLHGSFFAIEERLLSERRLDEVLVKLLIESGETKRDWRCKTHISVREEVPNWTGQFDCLREGWCEGVEGVDKRNEGSSGRNGQSRVTHSHVQ